MGDNYSNRNRSANFAHGGNRQAHLIAPNLPYIVRISNLPEIVEGDIDTIFNNNKPKCVRLVHDRQTGMFRGCAYLEFDTKQQVDDALKLDGAQVDGRIMHVEVAQERRRNQPFAGSQGGNQNFTRGQDVKRGYNSDNFDRRGHFGYDDRRNQSFDGGQFRNVYDRSRNQIETPQSFKPHNAHTVEKSDAPERPRLVLQSRSVGTSLNAVADTKQKQSIFGNARPREENLAARVNNK